MTEIDSEWTTADAPANAKTYKLAARGAVYLISIGGKFVKVKVTGGVAQRQGPIIVEPDYAPFREAASRPRSRG